MSSWFHFLSLCCPRQFVPSFCVILVSYPKSLSSHQSVSFCIRSVIVSSDHSMSSRFRSACVVLSSSHQSVSYWIFPASFGRSVFLPLFCVILISSSRCCPRFVSSVCVVLELSGYSGFVPVPVPSPKSLLSWSRPVILCCSGFVLQSVSSCFPSVILCLPCYVQPNLYSFCPINLCRPGFIF